MLVENLPLVMAALADINVPSVWATSIPTLS